ncbi:MAG: AAA family ATPase [Chlorobi bacterium]|nr:AAA family ATPase [Chlorobiota bacterium]
MIKIIAINILDDCKDYIRKNLQINEPYILYKNYKLRYSENKKQFLIQKSESLINDDFFSYDDKNKQTKINISAIVGKNGSGKSAIIDIILRLINNLAFRYIKSEKANINFIKGIRAQLYFSVNNKFYLLQQNGDYEINVDLFHQNHEKQSWNILSKSKAKKTLGESFFYTILMNYSLYAFNTLEYKEEWEQPENEDSCWLKGLFHKNDGYQTPVVLNPMRTEGNININRENSLAKDRLISLFFNEKDNKNSIFTSINETTKVNSISLKLDNESVERKFEKFISDWGNEQKKELSYEFVNKITSQIIKEWQKKYNFKAIKQNDKAFKLATQYLAYKTLSISKTYGNQFENSILSIAQNSKLNNILTSNELSSIEKFIEELDKESSHITFKLRQTLAFLVYRHISVGDKELKITIDDFSRIVAKHINNKWEYINFVPAPFIKTEIILENTNTKEKFQFSKLSSGERQMIYSASSILYHIRNINSIKGNRRRIKYRELNIILDEIELYFHPEFQRKYIDYLIKSVNGLNLKEIESVNIIMSTHSPFILSDIPESNVLFLSEGKSQKGISETFGANIHTLYKNNFFLEGMPIGEFAKNKIKRLFEKTRLIKGQDLELYNEIRLVGEQLLRTQLLKLYNQNSSGNLINKITQLENEVKILREKVNDKNSGK